MITNSPEAPCVPYFLSEECPSECDLHPHMKMAYRRVLNRIRGRLLEYLHENYETVLTDTELDDVIQTSSLLIVPELLEIAQIEARIEMAKLGHLGICLNFSRKSKQNNRTN